MEASVCPTCSYQSSECFMLVVLGGTRLPVALFRSDPGEACTAVLVHENATDRTDCELVQLPSCLQTRDIAMNVVLLKCSANRPQWQIKISQSMAAGVLARSTEGLDSVR